MVVIVAAAKELGIRRAVCSTHENIAEKAGEQAGDQGQSVLS
jgi:hypothetical protein